MPDHGDAVTTRIGICTLSLATRDDCATVMGLRDAAARWLQDQGISQWTPGELPRSYFEDRIDQQAVWLMKLEGETVATATIAWEDPQIWGPRESPHAGYIHGLVIDRRRAGQGLGRDLLTWAERHISDRGGACARLDCVHANRSLRAYYEHAGYVHVGSQTFPDIAWARDVALYEKPLRTSGNAPPEGFEPSQPA